MRVLYPSCRIIGRALWDELDSRRQYGRCSMPPWPQVDPAALAQDEIELVLQINGKLSWQTGGARDASRDEVEAAARAGPEVAKHAAGKPVKRSSWCRGDLSMWSFKHFARA
jgi:leucyl-tRNA synthetase